MAKAHIQEYAHLAQDANGQIIPVGKERAVATQSVTYTTATQSSAFDGSSSFIRIIADADAFIAFGTNPTADADSLFLPANVAEYFGIEPGDKVSVYDGSS